MRNIVSVFLEVPCLAVLTRSVSGLCNFFEYILVLILHVEHEQKSFVSHYAYTVDISVPRLLSIFRFRRPETPFTLEYN